MNDTTYHTWGTLSHQQRTQASTKYGRYNLNGYGYVLARENDPDAPVKARKGLATIKKDKDNLIED